MSAPLIPCTLCERHVRSTESRCPFCDADLDAAARPAFSPVLPQGRLSSLAVMTFRAAALGAALTACGGSSDDEDDSAKTSTQSAGNGGKPASNPDDIAGSSSGGTAGTGTLPLGGATFGGSPDGGQVSIYRATPKG